MKSRKIALYISIAIILISIVSIIMLNLARDPETFPVQNGVLDLSGKEKIDLMSLSGEWEFYPGVLITDVDEHKDLLEYIKVPGNFVSNKEAYNGQGYVGTYRLVIKVPVEGDYGIKTSTIRSSSKVFVNGQEAINVGKPSLVEEDYLPGSRYEMGIARSESKEIEIIVQTASYDLPEAGIMGKISFGKYSDILNKDRANRTLDGVMIIICLVLSLHSLLSFFHRPNDIFILYAGATGFFLALYTATLREQLIFAFIEYSFSIRLQLQLSAMLMINFCFLKFIQHFYSEFKNRKAIKILSGILLFTLFLVLLMDTGLPTIPAAMGQKIIGAAIISTALYTVIILSKHAWKEKGETYSLIISTALLAYWLLLIFKIFSGIEILYNQLILIIIMAFSVSLAMGSRLQEDKKRAEILAEELLVRDNMKNDFLARTSHELRTPLHTIINLTYVLMEGERGPLNIKQREDIFFMSMEARRLSKLVDDLMDASYLDMSEISLNKEMVNPYKIIESMSQEYRLMYKDKKDIEIINNITKDFKDLYVDPDRFRQILVNILDNAFKFTDRGSINISAEITGEFGKISIVDTGFGIEASELTRVFDSFYRKKNEEKGLGLGLSIVKELVEGHGGQVWAESQLGKGTNISFTLPLYEDVVLETTKKEKIGLDLDLDLKLSANILVVEDEPSHVKVLTDLLEPAGYNLLVARTGEDAFEIIEKNKIDLAIIDVMLPNTSGDQICKKLRESYTMPELPIIIMTASGRNRDFGRAFECGANDFIKKPTDPLELKTRIKSLLLMKASYEAGLDKEFFDFYSQLSPHFLYNTLNSIIGLSFSDVEGTRDALTNLGTYLRHKMDSYKNSKLVDLESEIELALAYLEIEKLRYGERLDMKITGDTEVKCMIPPLSLQPIVENSVSHGINYKERLEVHLDIKDQDTYVEISIKDNGPGIKDNEKEELLSGKGKGLGLTNVIRRISLLKDSSITIEDGKNGGTIVTMKVVKE